MFDEAKIGTYRNVGFPTLCSKTVMYFKCKTRVKTYIETPIKYSRQNALDEIV